MTKNRKGLGKKYGKIFKEKQITNAINRVYTGNGNSNDFDIVFNKLLTKNKNK